MRKLEESMYTKYRITQLHRGLYIYKSPETEIYIHRYCIRISDWYTNGQEMKRSTTFPHREIYRIKSLYSMRKFDKYLNGETYLWSGVSRSPTLLDELISCVCAASYKYRSDEGYRYEWSIHKIKHKDKTNKKRKRMNNHNTRTTRIWW